MIYQYDQAIQLPTKDLYDTQVMQMAIAAAKDMYEKGEKQINDFYEKYQDFYSPIPGATEMVYNEGIGKLQNLITDIYTSGGDPLRTVEGRAKIAQAIRSVNIAKINQAKRDAEFAKQYITARGKAIADGTYDEDFERWRLGGKTLEEWDPNTPWMETAPGKYQTMDSVIEPIASGIDPAFDAALTTSMNDGYDYSTVSKDRLRKVIDDNLDNLITKSSVGGYYYKKALDAAGGDKTLAKKILGDWYAASGEKFTKENREINQYKLDNHRTANDIKQQASAAAINYKYKQLEKWDFDGNGKLDEDENTIKKETAKAYIEKLKRGLRDPRNTSLPDIFVNNYRDGDVAEYVKEHEYAQGISIDANSAVRESNGYMHTMDASEFSNMMRNGSILKLSNSGKILRFNKNRGGIVAFGRNDEYSRPGEGDVVKIVSLGKLHNIHGRYYIETNVVTNLRDEDGNKYTEIKKDSKTRAETTVPKWYYVKEKSGGNNTTFLIPVKPREANYGKQQESDKKTHDDREE